MLSLTAASTKKPVAKRQAKAEMLLLEPEFFILDLRGDSKIKQGKLDIRKVHKPDGEHPKLIAIVKREVKVRVKREALTSLDDAADVSGLDAILKNHGAILKLLFGTSEDRLQLRQKNMMDSAAQKVLSDQPDPEARRHFEEHHPLLKVPDMSTFYLVEAPEDRPTALQGDLLKHPLLNTYDNDFSQVGHFSRPTKDAIWVTSPWGMGLMETSGNTMRTLAMIPNGTRIGGWLLNTADNRFGPVGDFDGDGIDEIVVTSPWGIGSMKYSNGSFTCLMLQPNGTRFGGWLLNTADNLFQYARDFDGDAKAGLFVSSPWGIGLLKLAGGSFSAAMMQPNNTRFQPRRWLLNTDNDWLGCVGDYDGDGKAEMLVESPWGVGVLKMSGSTLAAPIIRPNGTVIGGWSLATDECDFGFGV